MDEQTLDELKVLLEQLNTRIEALEHTVNDVIIDGWKKADEEYRDTEAHKAFSEKYGDEIAKYAPYFKTLYGDDSYDLDNELYQELKSTDGYGTDGFDEDALLKAKFDEIGKTFSDLKGINAPVETKEETVVVSPEDKEYDELANIYKDYKSGKLGE